jgi:hypothetical protein
MTQATIDLVSLVDKSRKLADTTKRVYRAAVKRWVVFAATTRRRGPGRAARSSTTIS